MANNQSDGISFFENLLKRHLRFPDFALRRPGGLKILAAAVVLVIVCYNLFFVYVRPDE
jgi:hypothetical protein